MRTNIAAFTDAKVPDIGVVGFVSFNQESAGIASVTVRQNDGTQALVAMSIDDMRRLLLEANTWFARRHRQSKLQSRA